MLRRISPELKFGQPEIVRLFIPKPGEVFIPRDSKFTLVKPTTDMLNLSKLSADIQRSQLITFKRRGEDNAGDARVAIDRRCDRCTYRHPSAMDCGSNMLIKPRSFRPKRMFSRGMKLNSSGL